MWGQTKKIGDGGTSPHGGTLDFMGGLQNPLETMVSHSNFVHLVSCIKSISPVSRSKPVKPVKCDNPVDPVSCSKPV